MFLKSDEKTMESLTVHLPDLNIEMTDNIVWYNNSVGFSHIQRINEKFKMFFNLFAKENVPQDPVKLQRNDNLHLVLKV
jgi:hypothetical protein